MEELGARAAVAAPPIPAPPMSDTSTVQTKSAAAIQDDVDPELLALFLEEADELFPQIDAALGAWRAQPGDAQRARKLQRGLHTFKGSARMAGAMRVGELIHCMESRATEARAPYPPAFWSDLENNLAEVKRLITLLHSGTPADTGAAATEDEEAPQASLTNISKRLYRVVRQTGKALGKKTNLELLGTELILARNVLEKMTAPLEHLLRNAIAHGLENPAQRERAGKPPIGEIRLSLRRESKEIVFDFSDDGMGLDIEGLRRRAVALGVLRADAAVSEAESMQLVFVPGLSTATEVTEIAGRGMGMDVVKSEIAALGGHITASSERGRGTHFEIRLPLAAEQNCEGRSEGLQ
jgi:chemotaxis protein histidine kinase CheA